MDPVKVGSAIKKLRNIAGYTQHDVARHLNVTDKAVSKCEFMIVKVAGDKI